MARKKVATDYHVVPHAERDKHVLNGHECPCEPICVVRDWGTRVFVHSGPLMVIYSAPQGPPPNAGLIGPGG